MAAGEPDRQAPWVSDGGADGSVSSLSGAGEAGGASSVAAVRYVISGGRPLHGRVRVQGAKNGTLPLLAACLLASGPCRLVDAPPLADVLAMVEICRHLGAAVHICAPEVVGARPAITVDPSHVIGDEVPEVLARLVRSSVFLLGPLLAKRGRARVALPGGCEIGPRPVDLHLRGLQSLGATVRQEAGHVLVEARRLRGADIYLDVASVGATENLMMAATAATGTTVIRNAAREPEIADLQTFLCRLGAKVSGGGTSTVTVLGGRPLGAAEHTVIPDRIEAGTFLLATAIAGGEIELENAVPEHLGALAAKLAEAGFPMERGSEPDVARLSAAGRARAVDVRTQPYPGFPTDLQNPFLALLLTARGTSVVTETVFEERFRVAAGFRRMGAEVKVEGRRAMVVGAIRLQGAEVQAGVDLRGAAALVLAGLGAEGTTVVRDAACIARGYLDLAGRLRSLGASVHVVPEPVDRG